MGGRPTRPSGDKLPNGDYQLSCDGGGISGTRALHVDAYQLTGITLPVTRAQ